MKLHCPIPALAAFLGVMTASANFPFSQGIEIAAAECYILNIQPAEGQPNIQALITDPGQVADLRPFEQEHVSYKLERYQEDEIYVYRSGETRTLRTYRTGPDGEPIFQRMWVYRTLNGPTQAYFDDSPFILSVRNQSYDCRLDSHTSWSVRAGVLTAVGYKAVRSPLRPGRPHASPIVVELALAGISLPSGCDGEYDTREVPQRAAAPRDMLQVTTFPLNFELHWATVFPRLK